MRGKKIGVFVVLAAIVFVVNLSIYRKEALLAHGRTVCLALAPVDPRSMMQGDYMALHFAIADTLRHRLGKTMPRNGEGIVVLRIDENCIAEFDAIYRGQSIASDRAIMRYRIRNGRIKLTTDAYYFQEGMRTHFDKAAYGVFKVDEKTGEALLVELKDADLKTLR